MPRRWGMDGYVHDTRGLQRGVSLLEILVAAAIVALRAALAALPAINMLRATREARAIANLKCIADGEMMLYGAKQRFCIFEELFREGGLARQFERGASGGGRSGSATEAI